MYKQEQVVSGKESQPTTFLCTNEQQLDLIFSPRLSDDALVVEDEKPAQQPPIQLFRFRKLTRRQLKQIKQIKGPSINKFNQDLNENIQYQQLQIAIKEFECNNLENSDKMLWEILEKSTIKLKQTQDKKIEKQYALICLQSHYYLSKVQQSKGLQEEAKTTLLIILEKYEIQDLHTLAQLYLSLGNINRVMFRFQDALNYFYQALLKYEQLNWKIQQADCMMQLGVVFAMIKEYENAKKLTYEALEIYRNGISENDIRVGKAYFSLGKIFYYSKTYEIAHEYLERSLIIHIKQQIDQQYSYKNKTEYNLIPIYNLLGILMQVNSQSNDAIHYFTKAILCYKGTIDAQLGQILNNIGIAHQSIHELEVAQDYLGHADQVYGIYFNQDHPLRKKVQLNLDILFDEL